ncbi:MAG: fumarylacetoacetate hydrolase family protein [Planctomycetota bacterium]|nr:fumarylacetoacetate hydrolase family protein [Planctomycetota bacterium]
MKLERTPVGVQVLAPAGPVLIRHVIGIGKNYADHAKEQGAAVPERPVLFTKNPLSASLTGDDIVIPPICQDREQVDFEAELAFLIAPPTPGVPIRDVPIERAFEFVLGYCCANDVSARWWQKEGSGGQFNRGKSFDTFCPIGPELIPARDVPDPQNLRVRCEVNGVEMQNASTREMIFPVARLVHELTRGTTLLPGTLVLTGTPSGVGMARTPPVWLKAGDRVTVAIETLGSITNTVRLGKA